MHKRSSSHPPLREPWVLAARCRVGDEDQVDACRGVGVSLQGGGGNKGVVPAPWIGLGLLRGWGWGAGRSFREGRCCGVLSEKRGLC